MSPAVASATYRSSRAVDTARPSTSTVVHDEVVERRILCHVAFDSREADYRDAMKALVDCGPKPDAPTDADLKRRGVRIRF
jgi:hypothetical protein